MRDIDAFYVDVEELVGQLKSSPLAEGSKGVFLPGEIEDIKSAQADRDGLAVSSDLVGQLEELAGKTGVTVPIWKS
jgi:LDH2 family malate/lactate/ureidoglycolate dehydrogenase